MTDETTSEQLAEIEGQAEDTPATEYTPPEGWRVLAVGERLRDGDVTVRRDGYQYPTERVGGWVGSNQRYIRPIEPQPEPEPPDGWQLVPLGEPLKGGDEYHAGLDRYIRPIEPQPQPQPQAEPVQVREGRWKTRNGAVKNIRPCEPLRGAYFVWPWTDGFMTYQDNGRHLAAESDNDLVEYLGPIEPEPQQVNDWPSVRDLRHELKTVQTQLGESRQRVTQLEELVGSLRTINVTQEKAFEAAGKENTALRNQLTAAKAELASVAADRQQLRVELDAAQQVPADSPELRQLWADLAEVAHDRDTYKHAHELLVQDIDATHQRTKAMTVEAIAEWLVPVQAAIAAADNVAESTRAGWLAEAVIQHLPSIMRSLTGLVDEEPDPQLAPY